MNKFNTFIDSKGHIFCLNCSKLIGVRSYNENIQDEFKTYYLSKSCKICEEMKITMGITGLKLEKLEILKGLLNNLFSNHGIMNRPKLKVFLITQTKETLLNFKISKECKDLNILIIVHKNEGRLFLLGRNGFYNKICQEFENILKGYIYFFLLYKNIFIRLEDDSLEETYSNDFQFQTESIKNLIEKGDQQELKAYKDENKIVCLDDDLFENDIQRRKFHLELAFFKNYIINYCSISNKNFEVKGEVNEEEKNLIYKLQQHLNTPGAIKQGFNCQIL
jgi:hypothetical protein